MEKTTVIEILREWNFWDNNINTGTPRNKYLNNLYKQRNIKEVSAILGVRRSGKSTIGLQVLKKIIDSGVNPRNTLYVNFEEPKFAPFLSLDFLIELFEAFTENIAVDGKKYIFFDEVQNIENWEKFVRGTIDKNQAVKIYVSGSSAKLLSKEFGSILTGRYIINEVFPLSFLEFLQFNNITAEKKIFGEHKTILRRELNKYIEYGGFPQVVSIKDSLTKKRLLKDYFEGIITKDVSQRYEIRDDKNLREFAVRVITNNGNLWSSYDSNKVQSDLSSPTANNYLNYIEETYLISVLKKFDFSLKKQTRYPRKLFTVDPGMYNAIAFKSYADNSKLLESIVFSHFRSEFSDIYYWIGEYETDIVFKDRDGSLIPLNVTASLKDRRVLDREIRSLEESMAYFNSNKGIIVSLEDNSSTVEKSDMEIKAKNRKIEIINVLDLLLGLKH